MLIGDLWCDFGVICLSCACEDAAGFEVSKISLRFTLWPNYFDEIYDDVDGNVDDMMIIIMWFYDDECDGGLDDDDFDDDFVDVDDNYYDNY